MSSSVIIQQELISLLITAKKGFLQGRDMCDQANLYQQSSENCIETIEKIHPKLLFIDNHILRQVKTLERMRDYIYEQGETCQQEIKENESKLQILTMELTDIFNLLKDRHIDKDILQVNKERGGEVMPTLFDYISDQEIIELQRQADDEIGELESIYNSLQNQAKLLTTFIQELNSKRRKIKRYETISERIQYQEEEALKMADILTSLMKHYDQVEEATRISQQLQDEIFDISILKNDDDHLPSIQEELTINLNVVISINEEICNRMEYYLDIQKESILLFNQLESFEYQLVIEKILELNQEMQQKQELLEQYFEQLSSLATWYQCYASSYNYLLLEIDRRKKAQLKQESLIKELLNTFEVSYNDELQERRSWSTQHGQYLPEILCPFINDAPAMIHLQLEESSRLPNLSKENVDKALAEIHNEHNNK